MATKKPKKDPVQAARSVLDTVIRNTEGKSSTPKKAVKKKK
ncbi:MAG TPA: hypothetical protein VGO58_12145 [Chitinophagaceae bacterium]|jgi:hypothetical protein|nr:hypothetical protein [Chitinophagaceae bacterium]